VDNNVVIADQYEPDNTQSTAKGIHPDSAGQIRTLKKGDTDWVSFSALTGKSYKIFTTGNTDTRIKVYSSAGSLPIVEGDDSPGNVNASVVFNCSSSGKYYICVSGNDETVTGAYALSVVSSVGPDAFEPDSIPALASSISTSTYQNRSLQQDDEDWIACYLSLNDTVLLTAVGTCPILMTLYGRDTVTLMAASSGGDTIAQIKYRITATGTYFVKVAAASAILYGSYRLTMQTSSSGTLVVPDAYENDNTRSTAKLIPGNSATQLRSLTPGDTDWVALPVVGGRQYTLTFSSTGYALAILYAKDGTVLQGPSSSLFLNSSATDTVYVKIYSSAVTALNYSLNSSVLLQPTIPDEYEVDNTKAQAKTKCFPRDSLLQDHTLTVVNFVSDTDWVAFPVMAGKQYTFRTVTSSSSTLYMYLYDNSSSSYIQYASSSPGSIVYTPTVSDTMYLQLYRPYGSTALAYTLSVRGQFSNDSFEPDSSRATAKPLATTIQNHILLPNDTDWVIYTATPGDSMAIMTTGTTDTKISLFSSSGSTPIAENDDIGSGNTNAMISWKSAYGGQFYVRVVGKTPLITGPYALQALSVQNGTLVAADSLEIDNTKARARLISDTILAGEAHSLTVNDTDWVAFPVLAGGQYTVTASGSTYLSMYGYTSKDSLIGSRVSTSSASIACTPMKNDTLYFRVTSAYTVQRYTLSMSRIAPPSPDLYENDNTKAQARLISDTILTGQVHSLTANDTDWIAFPVQAGGSYTVTASSSTYALSMYGYTARDSLFGYYSSSTGPYLTRTSMTNDTLYYRITSPSPIARYTISMTRVAPPAPDAYEIDNTRTLAYKASGSFSQSRTITFNDTDWVAVPVVAGGRYTMSTSSSAVLVVLYNQAGVLLGSSATGSLVFTATAADTFYYQISAAVSSPTSRYTLSLAVILSLAADSYENDNSMGTAKALLTDSTVQDRTITLGDTDYVSFRGNAGDRVTIRAAKTSTYYTYLYIYDSAGVYQTYNYSTSGNATVTYALSRTGLFYCRITSLSTSSYAYSLSAVIRKIDTLAVGTASSRTLVAADTQWAAVRLDSGKTYTIQTTGSLDTRLWLYDSTGATSYLLFDDVSGVGLNALLTYTSRRTGLFFIKVAGTSISTAGSFGLTVTNNAIVSPVVGSWSINYNWTVSGSGTAVFVLNASGTFTVGTSTGTWTYVGTTLTLTYPSGTVYTGTVSGNTVTGTMISGTQTGTFTGVKQ
jgi:hypothetical protein